MLDAGLFDGGDADAEGKSFADTVVGVRRKQPRMRKKARTAESGNRILIEFGTFVPCVRSAESVGLCLICLCYKIRMVLDCVGGEAT